MLTVKTKHQKLLKYLNEKSSYPHPLRLSPPVGSCRPRQKDMDPLNLVLFLGI